MVWIAGISGFVLGACALFGGLYCWYLWDTGRIFRLKGRRPPRAEEPILPDEGILAYVHVGNCETYWEERGAGFVVSRKGMVNWPDIALMVKYGANEPTWKKAVELALKERL